MAHDAVTAQPGMADAVATRARRALSLDALRGVAILGMVLHGFFPHKFITLPPWMYHAQFPPPTHKFNPTIVGITWVDLVFPLFLFALGAAVPLALARRIHDGAGRFRLSMSAFSRGLLLLFFALFESHVAPGLLAKTYGNVAWGIGLFAFLVMFAIFTRLPNRWPAWQRFLIRAIGWISAAALLAFLRYENGVGFSVHRHDLIIVILANVAVTTSIIWLWSPHRYTGRLCIMGVVVTAHLVRRYAPWGSAFMDLQFLQTLLGERVFNGLIWACNPAYQKYLLITLPGTIVGDVLLTWLRPAAQRLSFSIQNSRWGQLSVGRCVGLAITCLALVVLAIAGLSFNVWLPTAGISVALGAVGFLLLYGPAGRSRMKVSASRRARPMVSALLFRALFGWGMLWLLLGLGLYSYQGGIRKEPATLSFLFVSAGLAHLCLVFFAVITEALHRTKLFFLLIDNGQNPLIAYVAGGMFVLPILHLVPAGDGMSAMDWLMAMTATPWAGFGRAAALMLVVAVLISVLTRLRIFWRT